MEYIIGSGAILEAGAHGGITPATLHANVAVPCGGIRAAAIDFEGTSAAHVQKLLVIAQGAGNVQARAGIEAPLRAKGDCSLADVLWTLAQAASSAEVHVFAHWLPDEETCSDLAARGVGLVVHPLETIQAASLVSGQRYRRVA
ncbi:MAG TPA: hypothetical protein VFL13_01670 [Candidatus Baltobacteraceae bacterium]|nr:hypothetical protein [Candidatus Baltobacteraceae bacterium]